MFFENIHSEPGCFACKLDKRCKTPRMKPVGNGKRGILFVGTAPTKRDDETGEPFSGESGALLEKVLKRLDIDLYEDCRLMYCVGCKLNSVRAPLLREIELCRESVFKEIRAFKPKVVCLLGKSAVLSVIGSKWKHDLEPFDKWRGLLIPFEKEYCVLATYDPVDMLKTDQRDGVFFTWKRDLSILKNKKEIENTKPCKYPDVEFLRERERNKYLQSLWLKPPLEIAFDYETNSLIPNAKGSKIHSVAFSTDGNIAYAMLYDPTILKHIKRILANQSIRKIAANMKFEESWTRWHLKFSVKNWYWDTMLASHIEDNRPSYNSLKFQVFIHFGIPDYSIEAKPFLVAKNGIFNRIHLLSEQKLLEYNGLDAAFEFKLAKKQIEKLS